MSEVNIKMSKTGKMSLIAPVIVLVCICFVASFLLAGVYGLTKPIIDELTDRTNTEARMAVLPTADNFTEITGVELVNGVKDAFVAKNGAGIVCRTSFNGFGGAVLLMVGVDANGQITGVQKLEASETPGIGSNVLADTYLEKFNGKTAAEEVDFISGASRTSTAVRNGVNAALAQFKAVKAAGLIK